MAGDSELPITQQTLADDAHTRAASEQLGTGLFVPAAQTGSDYANTLYQQRPAFRGLPDGRQVTPAPGDRAVYGPSGILPGMQPGQPPYMPTQQTGTPDVPRYPTATTAPGYTGATPGYTGAAPGYTGPPQTYPTPGRIPPAAPPIEGQTQKTGGLGFGSLIDWAALGGSAYYTYNNKFPDVIKARTTDLSPEMETVLAKSTTQYENSLADYMKMLTQRYEPQSTAFEKLVKDKGASPDLLLSDDAAFVTFRNGLESPQEQLQADVWRSYMKEGTTVRTFYETGLPEAINKHDFAVAPVRPSIPVADAVGLGDINPWAVTPRSLESMQITRMNKVADVFRTDLSKAAEEQTSLVSKLRNGAFLRMGALGVGDLLIDTHFNDTPGLWTSAADAGWAYGLISSVGAVGRFRSTPFLVGAALATHYVLRSAGE